MHYSRNAATILLFLASLWSGNSMADDASAKARPLVIVITGESNSGGVGSNADATSAERAPRPSVQVMNLTNRKFGFENLQLGVNNLRDHAGLESLYAKGHGFENELANAVDAGSFAGRRQVYLIKTGHGGSKIKEWDPQHASGYWKKFTQRIEAAKKQLPANPQWVVWLSLGINDAIGGKPIDKWKQETLEHLKRIKTQLPGAIIVITQFQSMRNFKAFDDAIADLATKEPGVFAVDSSGAALGDDYHWNYAGLKTVTQRLVETTAKNLK